ncbi:hypothetical protein FDB39_16965 [Clostridium botulinum]|nr:hypothetical protein [Clostridium botulinum]
MFIRSINIGDKFYNLEIDLNGTTTWTFNSIFQTDKLISILQELARERKSQFKTEIFFISDDSIFGGKKCIKYTVINPSKNFLNCKGSWNLVSSKVAKDFLEDYKDKTDYYLNSLDEVASKAILNRFRQP